MSEYAGIRLLDVPYCLDNTFDYYIPPDLRRDILCGDFVTVPFGTANKSRLGLVTSLKDAPENAGVTCKPILSVCDKSLSLGEEALGLCHFIAEQTLCTVGDAVRAMVPASVLSKLEDVYTPVENALLPEELDSPALFIYEYIVKKGKATLASLNAKFGPATKPALKALIDAGVIVHECQLKAESAKTEEFCQLIISRARAQMICEGEESPKLRSAKHVELLEYMISAVGEDEEVAVAELLSDCSATKAQLNALCDKGLLRINKHTIDRSIVSQKIDKKESKTCVLSAEQQKAFETLCALADSSEAHGALLHGITGSGKTSVMLALIDHVLAKGEAAIVLLPEIALTPQSLEIFCSRYGERVAVIHSALSTGERFDTHKRIKNGRADVIIGTRSAVFAPTSKRLGLIIIDEEQEHTYKSDMNPKYHARDIARFRCAHHKSLMVLASATPSFESYKKAVEGKYTLVELNSRYGSAKLPTAIVADMRSEVQTGNLSPIGTELCRRLVENQQKGEQAILFLNRRGYNNFISCRSCGENIKCPDCSVSMTYHTSSSSYDSGYLACHWCGRRMPLPKVCPSCSSEHLARMGYGTQRVEQELSLILPDSKILRMDADATTAKNSYDELLGKFRAKKADVLLGTQMVTKGHDFPDVTLVGVLLADSSLYLDDYRAAERTFAMLTQVIGRAGRSSKEGIAVIQTNNPDSECIKLACAQDYKKFYESEIRMRKLLVFPPFCDIALLTLCSSDERELTKASALLSSKLTEYMSGEYSDLPLITYGPFEAPVYKVDNKYRMRMVVKCRVGKRCREMLSELLKYFSGSGAKGLSLSIDINPTNL